MIKGFRDSSLCASSLPSGIVNDGEIKRNNDMSVVVLVVLSGLEPAPFPFFSHIKSVKDLVSNLLRNHVAPAYPVRGTVSQNSDNFNQRQYVKHR